MRNKGTQHTRGVTLIELLVGILLPSLGQARGAARSASCAMNLRTFGSAFEMYAAQDRDGARCSGAFDHLRDGDVREFGWVADVINMKVGSPGKMLCPTNRWRVNEKVADYTGAATTGAANPDRPHEVPVLPVGPKSAEMWAQGYNTNYAATWHFVRGDPTADDGYSSDGDPSDPSKCPKDGDGPLSNRHLDRGNVSADRIAVLGDSRAGDDADSVVTAAYAQTINAFADEKVLSVGDYTVESFTDGMNVDFSTVTGDPGRRGHEFNDIAPLHNPKQGDYVGGFANVLFADGHVAAIYDSGGEGDRPDGYLGAYKVGGTNFAINASAFRSSGGGGSVE
jgi:prepilin-type processing-associated H-X9-DG protein